MAARRKFPTQVTDPALATGPDYASEVSKAGDWLGDIVVQALTGVGGTANAVTATVTPALDAGIKAGMVFSITFAAANTGAMTLTVGAEPAIDLLYNDGSALGAAAVKAGQSHLILIDAAGKGRIVGLAPGGAGVNWYLAITATGATVVSRPTGVSDDAMLDIEAWGAGGGGGTNARGGGGGGGGYAHRRMRVGDISWPLTVTVGTGGAALSAGGNTTVGAYLTAYGGGACNSSNATVGGGGGGGRMAAGGNQSSGNGGAGGSPVGGAGGVTGSTPTVGSDALMGGGGGGGGGSATNIAAGGSSFEGGGGGGGGFSSGTNTTSGGSSYWGGGGGAGGNSTGGGGVSTMAGNGGAPGAAGNAPAGGGGRNAAGARGEVRLSIVSG